jgi:hypothetical protein
MFNIAVFYFAEVNRFEGLHFIFLFKYVWVDKVPDENRHFDSVDVVCQFANIPDLPQHIPQSSEINLIYA